MNKSVLPVVILILLLGAIIIYVGKSNDAHRAAATPTPTAEVMMHNTASPSVSPSAPPTDAMSH